MNYDVAIESCDLDSSSNESIASSCLCMSQGFRLGSIGIQSEEQMVNDVRILGVINLQMEVNFKTLLLLLRFWW